MTVIEFNPELHPRDRLGRFMRILRSLRPGDEVKIAPHAGHRETTVTRRRGGAFRVAGGRWQMGLRGRRFDTWSPQYAARAALDAAMNTPLKDHPPRPGQLGGFQGMTAAHMASPGTPEAGNAARSKRIFDIDFERSQLAARWRELSKSRNPLDTADAIEINAKLATLREERERLAREINATYPPINTPRAREIKQ